MRFDSQAKSFDQRAGLNDKTAQAIATTILNLANPTAKDILFEIGAGTGQIGLYLDKLPSLYTGMDFSKAMLDQFRQKAKKVGKNIDLIQGDANKAWPLEDHSAKIIFSSRTIHLLSLEHIIDECYRVASQIGSILILGSIHRDKTSAKEMMRKKMQQILTKHCGIKGKDSRKNTQKIIEICKQRGGVPFTTIEVAGWESQFSLRQSLESWQMVKGLAGRDISTKLKRYILENIQEWAEEKFASLDSPVKAHESYVLDGVWIFKSQ